MARNRVGIKGSNQRRVKQRDENSDESDEEYKVTDDEDFNESDECYSLDGEESEEISADFGKLRRVSRSRNTRRSSSGKKVNGVMKPQKKRKVSYTEDDADFMPLEKEANQVNKSWEKKRVSYTEEDDNDDDGGGDSDDDDEEYVFSGRNRKQRKKPREKKRVSYTEEDDDDDDGGGGGGRDDDDDEFMFSGRNRKQRKNPKEKKRVVYTEDDDDDDDGGGGGGGDDDDEDVADFMSMDTKANQVNKLMEKRVSYTEVDDGGDDDDVGDDEYGDEIDDDGGGGGDEDYNEFVFSGRNRKQRTNPRDKKRVVYTDDDNEDDYDDDEADVADVNDAEFMSSGGKTNKIKKPTTMKDSYTEMDDNDDDDAVDDDDDDHDAVADDDDEKEEDEDEYEEFVSSGRKRNPRKKPQEKNVVYTEDDEDEDGDDDDDDDDDDEFMYSSKKVNQKRNLLGKKSEVSYTEEDDDNYDDDNYDDDDSAYMSSSRKRNRINKRREKRIVSYKEDNQEEEDDENDAEFKLSESDFDDDEDETPKIKKNKVIKSHPQKKSKNPKPKNPTKPKQKNHNKTKIKNRKKKADWKIPMVESDSDFVNSASSDHEYTISEEEREQMREARVYCANLRAKLRSSSCGNQEKQPIRKGKEKIEDMKDDIGKQVCGICLSEEQKRTMRGVLNCCRHYFCFSCIMEWSKIESRCPLCKQRFTTITKAAKSDTGFDLRTVVIPVPECDQVYEPSEEELRGYLDPYESVICTECQNGGDDALMLLCDICDSSAHTFCVGLGREVPEGNWYCEGCRPTVFGTLNSDRRLNNNKNAPDLSSSPIAGGFDLNELYVPETPLTQQTRVHPEPNLGSAGTVATTLRDRRRLHRQIHHRFLNNNRMTDLVGRTSGTPGSSSGIRLFGSQLGEARASVSQNDHVFPSMHDSDNFYSRTDQFSVQVQNSSLASADVELQDEHVALQDYKVGFCNDPPVH